MSRSTFASQQSAALIFVSLAALAAAAPAFAQQAAEPASGEAQPLPAVEVVAKKKAAAPAKKKQVAKTAPPKAAPAQAAAPSPAPASPESPAPGQAGSATGPVKDYVATSSATGTKTDTPLKETPQSISVVGKEQIRDQGAQSLQEATRYMPGVFADPYGFDSRGDSTIIRGLAGAYFIDGLRSTYGYSQTTVPIEPYAMERIEVLRGPSSMLYGQAPTGGLVNAISKVPSEIAHREVGVEYGSFDFKQIKLDATGPLTQDGKWLYRIVGLARDADTQVDFVDNNRLMLAPSLTYRPTNDTSITLLGNYRNDQSGSTQQFLPAEGVLTPNNRGWRVPRSTFVGEPNDHYDTEAESVSVLFDHKFNESLQLHHASRYAHTENDYDSTYAAILTPSRALAINQALIGGFGLPYGLNPNNVPFLNADHSEVARARTITMQQTDVFNTDTNLTGKFLTGWVGHKLTGGIDYTRYGTDQQNAGTLIDNLLTENGVDPNLLPLVPFLPFPLQPAFNIYKPRYGQTNYYLSLDSGIVDASNITLTARPHEVQSQTGIYLQDQLKLGPWTAILGLRQDWLTIEEAGAPDITDTATTGRAALMYNFPSGLSPYISYSRSFSPLPGQPVGDNILVPFTDTRPAGPIEGEQVEIGVKYQPDGAPIAINAAIYELTDRNQIIQPDILFQGVQGADVNVRGFEIDATGKLTPELKVIASYSYTDATYEKYPELFPVPSGIADYMKGRRVDGIPEHLASLWAIYSVRDGLFRGLSFGGGVRYVSGSESSGRDLATGQELFVETPSFTLFDAMVAYETSDWRWQLTAQNLEDEYVVTSCAVYRGDCFIGQARTIITGFTYKF